MLIYHRNFDEIQKLLVLKSIRNSLEKVSKSVQKATIGEEFGHSKNDTVKEEKQTRIVFS